MPKMTNRRGPRGEMIYEPDDAGTKVEVEKGTEKALKAMTSGEKPKVSTDEPEDKSSIQYMVWKKKQNKLKSTGL